MSRIPLLVSLTMALAHATAQTPSQARVLPYPIDLPPEFEQAIANGTRTTTGKPGPKYWTNFARYAIEVDVDPATARLQGTAKMTYVNRSPDTLETLRIHLYQDLMRPGQPRTRFVRPTNGFELGEVRIAGEAVRARPRDTRLRLRLDDALEPGDSVSIEVDYAFDIPAARTAPRMGHEGDDVIYLGYWYPQFAVFDDVEGWVADPYRGNGEFYMGYADYECAITVPTGYIVRATGELTNADEVLTDKARQALEQAKTSRDIVHIVSSDDLEAGTATATSDSGKLTWRFAAQNVRDVAVSIGRTYLWDATHAVVASKNGPGKDGTCMIHAVYEQNSGDWVRAAEYAQHTIEYMSTMVYPYPWPHMTCCEGVIRGGMEFPMMTIVGGRQPAGTIAHELIHMWFPMLLGSNEKRYAWQDEGFTSFWTNLCRDDFTKRTNGRQRAIVGYVRTIKRGADAACMRHADTYGTDSFGFASYSKPAAMLHQLRCLLGDEVFFAAFRRYASDWAFKHPYPYDFFRSFSATAGRDLDPYFRTWLFETWTLDHAIGDVQIEDGTTTIEVVDRGRALLGCELEVTFDNEAKQRIEVSADTWRQSRSTTLRLRGKAVDVHIDPDIKTLDIDRSNNRWRESSDR